jgi:hypothetical protein
MAASVDGDGPHVPLSTILVPPMRGNATSWVAMVDAVVLLAVPSKISATAAARGSQLALGTWASASATFTRSRAALSEGWWAWA